MMKVKVESLYETNPIVPLQKYKKLIEQNPSNIAARYGLSLALIKNSAFEEAVNEFEVLRVRLPNTILMLAAYAEVLASAGQHQKAAKIVERRLAISPDNQPLSMIYAKTLMYIELTIPRSSARPLLSAGTVGDSRGGTASSVWECTV